MEVLFTGLKRNGLRKWYWSPPAAYVVLLVLVSVFAAGAPAVAQEAVRPAPSATTTSDPKVPLDQLKVALRPLTEEELDVELQGWLAILKAKITEAGKAELEHKVLDEEAEQAATTKADGPPDEADKKLSEQLIALRTEEAEVAEHVRVVIEALKVKGGDVEAAQLYIDAVSDLGEATDTTSFVAAATAQVTAWAARDDGGRLWLRRAVVAAILLVVFWIASKFAGHAVARGLDRHVNASTLLTNFARRTAGGVVFVIGLLVAVATLGVPLGPLMAALGGGGFIVGFALQDTLGNFASGLLIMINRPFDINDYVNIAGVEGTVKKMSLVSTTLTTPDNKLLVIPNKTAWGQTITNFTGSDVRRVDLVFGIGYDDDIQHAIDVLKQLAAEHKLVLEDPAPDVKVDQLGDSAVNLFCRPWVKTADYWTVHWDLTRQVKEHFDAEGISFPYPQRDVHFQPTQTPV